MTPREFMAAVLPADGWIIVATPRVLDNGKSVWINVSCETLEAAYTQINTWLWEQRDVYYALASFKEERVWNKNKKSYKGELGAWERRTHANVKALQTLFLDIDAKGGTSYFSQAEALVALAEFTTAVKLPPPTLVSSGFGVHAYWLLTEPVAPEVWKPVAEKLKAACAAFKLKADHAVTADIARVLRPVGTFNFKQDSARAVQLLSIEDASSLDEIEARLDEYLGDAPKSLPVVAARKATAMVPSVLGEEGNLGATNDPLNPDLLAFICPAFGAQVADRGATGTEPQWRAALALARFCEPARPVMLAVSDGHPEFSMQAFEDKVASLPTGPTKCDTFWKANPETCEGCPNWRKIVTPAQVTHLFRPAAPLTAEAVAQPVAPPTQEEGVEYIPAPPGKYKRLNDSKGQVYIGLVSKDPDGFDVVDVACPVDIYPKRLLRHVDVEGVAEENSVWMVNLSRVGWNEFKLPNSILSDLRKLHAFMLAHGVALNPKEAKSCQFMMVAYLKQLHQERDRERTYDRLGWHDKYTSFVLPYAIYFRDGTKREHAPNRELLSVTRHGMHTEGSREESIKAMSFYCGPGNFSFRFGVMASLGSLLLHMTGHKGVLITATGDTGRGKTTMIEAAASLWGQPEALKIGGGKQGSTINAFYLHLGIKHSLPVFWDDTTERDPDEMREFLIHISSGSDKERLKGHEHSGRTLTWETMVISSTNADDVYRILASGKNVDPHLMRLLTLEFEAIEGSPDVKLAADRFKRTVNTNYGWIGPEFAQYVVKHYQKVEKFVLDTEEWFARELNLQSEDRFRSAALSSTFCAGVIANRLGLLPYNPKDDIEEFRKRIAEMKLTQKNTRLSSAEILSEYLTMHQQNTLILHAKGSSNVDNIVHEARGPLYIRHEVDTGKVFLSRTAFNAYCNDQRASFKKIETELVTAGVITRRDCYKVLGADTKFATSQIRCWEISMDKLNKECGK